MLARTCRRNNYTETALQETTICKAHLAHAIGRLPGQVDLVQAEEVVAVLALLAAARAEHKHVTGFGLVIK
jgi:hypothetical protein